LHNEREEKEKQQKECYHIDLNLVKINKDIDGGGAVFRCVLCNEQITNDVWIKDAKGSLPFKEIQKRLTKFYREEVKKRDERSRNAWR
jgi:hypothetical protein